MNDLKSEEGGHALGDEPYLLSVPAQLTIENAEEFLVSIRSALTQERQALVCDFQVVEQLTTPGVQLLLSLEKTLQAAGGKFFVRGQSAGIAGVMRSLGLSAWIT